MADKKEIDFRFIPMKVGNDVIATISARELWAKLEVGGDFSNWIKQQIRRAHLQKDRDYVIFAGKEKRSYVENDVRAFSDVVGRGSPVQYHLTPEAAKMIGMMSGSKKGIVVREYFLEMERLVKDHDLQLHDNNIPKDLPTALRLYADELEQKKLLETKLIQQAPMVEFAEVVMARGQDMSITAAGKHLGFAQGEWFKFIRDTHHLVIKRSYHHDRLNRKEEFNEASSGMIQAGFMSVRFEPNEKGIPFQQTFVTPEGLEWLKKFVESKK